MWIYLRHYINLRILWAVCTEFKTVGPFELNWETQQYKCWISQYITFSLLAMLQAVNVFWLFLILRIAKNYLLSNVAEDERSENEESDEETAEVEATAEKQREKEREKFRAEQQHQHQQRQRKDRHELEDEQEEKVKLIDAQPRLRSQGPVVLVNGEPVDGEAVAPRREDESVRERRKRKAN